MMAVGQADLAHQLALYKPIYLIRYGGRIGDLSAVLRFWINRFGNPGVVVTNVGTTDARRPAGPQTDGPVLRPLVQATSAIHCVVLTTVDTTWDQRNGGTTAADVNRQEVALERSDPVEYKIVDWNWFVATLPAPSLPTYVQSTTLLETPAGAQWLAKADQAAVRTCTTRHQPTVIGPNR